MRKVLLFFLLGLFFIFAIKTADAQFGPGTCGYNSFIRPDCPLGDRKDKQGRSCSVNSECCTNVCILPQSQGGINQDVKCGGNEACLQALALSRAIMAGTAYPGLGPSTHPWWVQSNGDGTYTVVCDNGWFDATFKGPTATPTPVPASPTPTKIPPACGVKCSTPADCQGAKDFCTSCVNKTCQKPPAPTPVPACNVACVKDADCQGAKDFCTSCVNKTCQRPPTPTPKPTSTPTPTPFNAAACKCDGIEYTDLFSGQTVTITSFGKVQGADTSKAIVKNQSFFLAEGAETIARIIGKSGPINSIVVPSTPDKVRFQSKWTFTLPQLKPGATYRIWSQINCQPKLQALNYTPTKKAILAASTEKPKSFVERMIDFLNRLFGAGQQTPAVPVETQSTEGDVPTSTERGSLQLKTIYPVEVYDKSCSFIKFRFDQPSR